jgi:hypothetical protein
MTIFLVVVEGRNCEMASTERHGLKRWFSARTERLGFFASRHVEAANPQEAALMAVGLVRRELAAKHALKNLPLDPPRFTVAKVRPLDADAEKAAGKGFTFFKELLH